MRLGYIGLGKMGKNMVLRLLKKQHQVVVWNRSPEPRQEMVKQGAMGTRSVQELVEKLPRPRIVWVMLPAFTVGFGEARPAFAKAAAGRPAVSVIEEVLMSTLAPLLSSGDMVIDGGNSRYLDTQRRARILAKKGIELVDVGVSGGPEGAREGACLMVGGKKSVVERLKPLLVDLAAYGAWAYFGRSGAGHLVKMVHNGIEYGMMQAIGEGFAVLKSSGYDLDLQEVARVYNRRSVIESRLVGWLHKAYGEYGQHLEAISGSVAHSGEGQWTVEEAKKLGIPVPVIEMALQFRIKSQQTPSYTGKVVSALRNQFGGHDVKMKNEK